MSRFAHVTIAGIALQNLSGRWCRVDFLDAEALKSTVVSTSVVALDNTVHTQWTDREHASVRFGVQVAQLHISKLDAVVAAMEAALRDGESFAVSGADANNVDVVDVMARLDYEALGGKPYTRGQISSGYVKDVIFRFIATN